MVITVHIEDLHGALVRREEYAAQTPLLGGGEDSGHSPRVLG